jgi:hypothetical protein
MTNYSNIHDSQQQQTNKMTIPQDSNLYFNNSSNLIQNQQTPILQNLFNTLKHQYPLLPPAYIYTLLAQQQQQPHVDSTYCQFKLSNKQQQQEQQSKPSLQQPSTNFSIENIFDTKKDKSISSPVIISKPVDLPNDKSSKCCDHKEELYLLRQNVYKMLYKNLPNVLLAFNLLNDPFSPQIDCILQSLLLYNQENESGENHSFEIKNFFNQYPFSKPSFSTTI